MGGRVRKVVSAPPEGGAEIDHRRIAPRVGNKRPEETGTSRKLEKRRESFPDTRGPSKSTITAIGHP